MRKSKIRKRAKKATPNRKWKEPSIEKKIRDAYRRLRDEVEYCPMFKKRNQLCTTKNLEMCAIYEEKMCNFFEHEVLKYRTRYFKQSNYAPKGDVEFVKSSVKEQE